MKNISSIHKRPSAWLLPVILALVLSAPVRPHATGNTYYVATNGGDANSGTIGAPWLTIQHAVAQLHPGDTLYIRGGTYTGSANTIDSTLNTVPGGTPSAPITIAGYPGDIASQTISIQHPDSTTGILLNSSAQQYLVFQDFTVDGINLTGAADISGIVYVSSGASHNTFQRMEIKNGWISGVNVYSSGGINSPFNQFLQCLVHDNGRQVSAYSGYGYYIDASDTLIDGGSIYNNGGEGLQIFNARNTLRKAKISTNGTHATSDSPVIAVGSNVTGPNYTTGVLIYDNLIYSNNGATGGSDGVLVYTYSLGTLIYNNTIYNNGGRGVHLQYYDSSAPPIIRNNIIYLNAGGSILDEGDLNGMTGNYIADHNLLTDPSFLNAGGRDFHLTAASGAAISQGASIGVVVDDFSGIIRPPGKPQDIGAYKYVIPPSRPTFFQVS